MDAVAEFLSGLPSAEATSVVLPLRLEVDAMAGNRVADVALLLGLIGVFWALGHLFRSAGMPRLRPFVFASGLTGILLLFFTNTAFWMVKGLEVDDTKITLTTHLGSDQTLAWADLEAVEFDSGKLFPAFSDDASLVLIGPDDHALHVPRFIPGVERAIRAASSHLQAHPSAPRPDARTPAP
jgi:hypothetical protein